MSHGGDADTDVKIEENIISERSPMPPPVLPMERKNEYLDRSTKSDSGDGVDLPEYMEKYMDDMISADEFEYCGSTMTSVDTEVNHAVGANPRRMSQWLVGMRGGVRGVHKL